MDMVWHNDWSNRVIDANWQPSLPLYLKQMILVSRGTCTSLSLFWIMAELCLTQQQVMHAKYCLTKETVSKILSQHVMKDWIFIHLNALPKWFAIRKLFCHGCIWRVIIIHCSWNTSKWVSHMFCYADITILIKMVTPVGEWLASKRKTEILFSLLDNQIQLISRDFCLTDNFESDYQLMIAELHFFFLNGTAHQNLVYSCKLFFFLVCFWSVSGPF